MKRPEGSQATRIKASRRRTRIGRVFDFVSWPVAAALLVASMTWVVSGWSWLIDLSANLTAQWLVLCLAGAGVWCITRRWRHALVAGAACMMCIAGLMVGRAAIWPRAVGSVPRNTPGLVRFLHYNASAFGDGPSIEDYMRLTDADVVSIVCPPNKQQTAVVYGKHLDDEYAGKLVRKWRPELHGDYTEITAGFVVSRWPMRAIDTAWLGDASNYLIAGVVERPRGQASGGGEFAVIAFHPRSPRTAERWATGNETTQAVADLAGKLREQGLSVVVLTDLNSTPTGYRSQHLYWSGGLRRAKPMLGLLGTYPNEVPVGLSAKQSPSFPARWPASIAIDDGLVSAGVEVVGWTVGPRFASGHLPIILELTIPAPTEGTTGVSARRAEEGVQAGR